MTGCKGPDHQLYEARRPRSAIGDVTELTPLARELAAGPAARRPLAARVTQLAGQFDFGARQALASFL
jgi:hypothetical protein